MRQLNVEILRILAMFLVLLVHTGYFSHGYPTGEMIRNSAAEWTWITFIQSLSVICVNIFILISGWFGINLKLKTICSFVFQVFFFLVISFIMMYSMGKAELSFSNVFKLITIIDTMWFVWAYLLLCIISPALNVFVRTTDKSTFKIVLIAFFAFQFLYGWTGLVTCFNGGYTTLSFIGLYLLARYMHVYRPKFTEYNSIVYLIIYILSACILTFCEVIIAYIPYLKDHAQVVGSFLFAYNNPLVILESCAFFFIFERIASDHFKKSQRIILYTAESTFAVYLLHANPFILSPVYKLIVNTLYVETNLSAINWIFIFLFILIVFFLAIFIDKIRISLWNFLWNTLGKISICSECK